MVRNDLTCLKGGQKAMWLRQHSLEVREYFRCHGYTATLDQFHLLTSTLDNVLSGVYDGESKPVISNKRQISDVEKALIMAEAAQAGNAETRRSLRELERSYDLFTNNVANKVVNRIVFALQNIPQDTTPDTILIEESKEDKGKD